MKSTFTAILRPEEDQFFASCPELDVASQGKTKEAALENLREAVALFLGAADPKEIKDRLSKETMITLFDVENVPCKVAPTILSVPVKPDEPPMTVEEIEALLRREGFQEVAPSSRAFTREDR
jgi:predicted RNase H-like HicB family nuclease